MSIKSPWHRERLYVLVGDRQVSTVWVKPDWRGQWQAHGVAHAPVAGELSLDALVSALRTTLKQWSLGSHCGICWFLPPDVLAVALVAKTPGNATAQLSLPFPQGQTLSRAWNEAEQACAWLWVHNGWVELFRQAAEAVGAQTLYLLPRAMFVGHMLGHAAPASSQARLQVVHDSAYIHMYVDGACFRSFSVADEGAAGGAEPPVREQEELASLATVFGLNDMSAPGIHRVGASADTFAAHQVAVTPSDTLHRSGLLMHSLADVAERRIQALTAVLAVLMLLGGGAALWHQKDMEASNQAMRRELREAVPKANAARDLKDRLARQSAFLAEMGRLNASPDAVRLLGRVADATPRSWTLGDMELGPDAATVAFTAPDARQFKASIETGDPAFPNLTAKPGSDVKQGDAKSVVRTYVAHARKEAP